jgi:outer membrane protein TolC
MLFLLLLIGLPLAAEPRVMTLRQVAELAEKQNPDVVLARLEAERARLAVDEVREPWLPQVTAGSGLAYTYGFPLSIEGSAPSIVELQATRSLFNAPRGYQTAQARESSRGAGLQAEITREEMVLRAAVLFLDLERSFRARKLAAQQVDHLRRVEAAVRLRVEEGRELPLEGKRAAVNAARAAQRARAQESAYAAAQRALALALGFDANTELEPALEDRSLPALPASEEASVAQAMEGNRELQTLESAVRAKELEAKSHRAMRLPSLTLVTKYGLFARYNNFEDYFLRFQRNNLIAGASFRLPLFANQADIARAAQASVEADRGRVRLRAARGRIESDTRAAWQRVQESEAAREVAQMDLELSRETVGVLLAQRDEGRATLQQIEQARFAETERWLAYYAAQYDAERARLELLQRTQNLRSALR